MKVSEADQLRLGTSTRALKPHADGKTQNESVAIGYGYDLLDLGKTIQQIKDDLSAVGITLSGHDETWLTDYRNGSATVTKAFLVQQAQANAFTTTLGSEPVAAALLTDVVDDRYEPIVTARLAQFGIVLPDSRERAALVSLAYANPTKLLGDKLMSAIASGNRAEAWYEIRYQSNGEGSATVEGTATRRFYESGLFGLYGEGVTIGDSGAKAVFRMYTEHREVITAYESRFGQGGTSGDRVLEANSRYGLQVGYWSQESQSARTFLLDTYAQFNGAPLLIDGEVLVGRDLQRDTFDLQPVSIPGVPAHLFDLSKNDLMFGERGDDFLHGRGGADVLYGGTGDDRLVGDAGNDYLFGGAGFDTYVWATGDGHDRIEDSDASGVIVVNGQMLVGGIKKAGHTDWTSLDGTLTYQMAGTDLIVKLDGTTIMTVNENFQSGQMGITLKDESALPLYDDGRPVMDISASFPGPGPQSWVPALDEDHNYIYRAPDNGGYLIALVSGHDQIYANNVGNFITAGNGHDRIYGGGGNDFLMGGNYFYAQQNYVLPFEEADGNDFVDGQGGNDTIEGDGGHDRLYGSAGNDLLYGDSGPLVYGSYGSPPGGDDFLDGGIGNDRLWGDYGADVLLGGAGDDVLVGDYVAHNFVISAYPFLTSVVFDTTRAKDDFLDGGDGADILFGDGGNDTLAGGAGNDSIYGDYGEETFLAGEGALITIAGNDVIGGGAGDDFLYGMGGEDIIDGGTGTDTLHGGDGADHLFGGGGNDLMFGDGVNNQYVAVTVGGDDVLDGGDGDDELQGNQGSDVLIGGAGVDTMFGHEGEDTLYGDEGDDFLYGDSDGQDPGIGANDFLDGGEGNDQLLGDGGADQLFGGAGNDLLFGDTDLNPQIAGADWLFGEAGDDQLHGGAGIDVLDGGTGSDIYRLNLGDGQDEIFEEDVIGDVNTIIFGPGITFEMLTFVEAAAQETLLIQAGAGGDSILVHGFTNNGVNGTGGMQHLSVGGLGYSLATLFGLPSGQIVGTFGHDIIKTGNGNDTIFAGDGHDTITANGGNDFLTGGAGNDTYTFNFGDGIDSIVDSATPTEGNRILFGAGITAANLTYTQSVNTLAIAYNGSADAVHLIGFDENTVLGSLVVSTIQFADGSVVNLADLFPPFTNHLPTVANPITDQTAPEDTPWTFVVPTNTFTDEDAGDVLTYSATLADGTTLPGWLSFDTGTATFVGTPDDAQVGTIGLRVTAADGRNAIVSDTFNLAVTNVNEAPTVAAPLMDQAATKEVPFTFVVPAGAFADVDPGDSLAYSATLADNSALPSWLLFNPSTRTFSGTPQMVDVGMLTVKVTARDTGNLSISDIFTLAVAHGLNEITGTSASDNLTGTAGNDLLRGLSGDDTLIGLDGNDTLEGGDGNDRLSGGNGSNTLDGGAGDDLLDAGAFGETGSNILRGGAGADRLDGYSGNDTFQGGTGNDTFYDAYGGQNVYLFDRGDGQDTIYSSYGTVRFASGVLPTEVTVRGNRDNSMTLSLNGTTDTISLFGWMNPFNTFRVDRVEFSDGTVWNLAMLQTMARAGTAGDDYLGGTNGNDVLLGLGGNDLLQTYAGDDVLDGGAGNDTLWGGIGDDTYVFGRGYGADLAQDDGGIADKIQLASGILVSNVTLLQNGSVLLLSIDQSATQMTFSGIEQIRFNDGTVWDAAAIASHRFVGTVNSMTGTAGNDTFVVDNTLDTVTESANQGTDSIQSLVSYTLPDNVENLTLTGYFNVDGSGNALNNVIIGNSGNNVLAGGLGFDTLQGGLGDDAYTLFVDGVIIEAPNQGIDSITFIGNAVIGGWNYTLPDHVENLVVASASQVFSSARSFYGNGLNNVIQGDANWFNYLDGGLGADTMIGALFSDTYVVDNPGDVIIETGSYVDTVLSSISYALGLNLENLTLTGTAALNGTGNELNNVLTGNSGANMLTGGAGDDTYVIGAGDTIVELSGQGTDTVSTDQTHILSADLENVTLTGTEAINATGNSSDNVLTGNSAANVLDGGAGADQLIGGAGDDTYLVGVGDTIVEQPFEGIDTVVADATFTLSNDLEHLTLIGNAAINGTGNASDNILTGNSGDNVLAGGAGDDTYVVDATDTIVENPGEGIDTVQASGSWVLANDLENLVLTGNSAINGTGNAAGNMLIGNSAANILTGGAGDDTYVVGSGDTIIELANQGTDTVQSSASFTLTPDLEHLTLTGTAAINGTGNAQNNILTGNSGANVLDGGAGADTMFGDAGDDTYVVDNAGDTVTENAAAGTDTVQSSLTYTLGANVEHLTLLGAATINGTGNALANVLTGNSAANILTGGAGNDTYVVGAGDTVTEAANAGTDTVHSSVTWTLGTNIEHLTLIGAAAINGTGNTLNNQLVGNSAANVLSGGTGSDTMSGGAGDDTYVVDVTGDVVTELANEGTDTVQSAITYTLGSNVENLTLTGTGAINGTGNILDNVLTGNSGANVLTGGAGNDTYVVGTGDTVTEAASAGMDTVQSAITWTLGANLENLTLTGTSAIDGTGNTLDNALTGNSGANVLTGGVGNDTMVGGAGNDTYVVDATGDVVTEQANEGTDIVQSAITYTLGANLENLTLTGTTAINGTGNALNNTMTGNTGNNTIDGGAGADAMSGGTGNDTYVVDNIADTVTEAASAGTDTVQSSVTFTLGANIENLTLTGTGVINGTGNTLANVLIGNSAANVISGGTGADTMSGGAGDDTYLVDVSGDVVTELANEGTDTVQSGITYTLGANLENLTLTGTTAINGTGNALDNTLTGNSATNVLTGGAGNDTYVVGTGDTVTEQVGAGTDTVQSATTWTLGANLENLTLTGATAINGTGNTLDNVLIGNSAANVLTGGAGNDTYVVGTGDTVTEQASAGTDTVQSAITWTLGANLENLTLTGTSAVNGTGNASNNILAGNSANNVLTGLGGNDTYLYSRGGGQDTVADNSGTADTMLFGATINPLDLVISRQVNDLRLAIHGGAEQVTIQNWYTSPTTNQVETIQAGNGQALLNTQVDQLIQAMAGFSAQTGLTWDQAIDQRPQDVQAVLAASWQP